MSKLPCCGAASWSNECRSFNQEPMSLLCRSCDSSTPVCARGASCPCGCCWWVVGLMTGWVVIKSIIWFPLFQIWAMKMRRFQVWSPKMSMYLLSKVVSIWILKIWKFKTYSPRETGGKTLARKVVLDPGEVIENF